MFENLDVFMNLKDVLCHATSGDTTPSFFNSKLGNDFVVEMNVFSMKLIQMKTSTVPVACYCVSSYYTVQVCSVEACHEAMTHIFLFHPLLSYGP